MGRKVVSGHAGYTGRTFINGNEFCQTSYNVQEIAEEYETTNSCSAGKNEYEYGNTHLEGSMEADWDIGANPYVDPPELRAGQAYGLRAHIHSQPGPGIAPSGPLFEIDNMKINNVRTSVPAQGKITVSFDFKSSGGYSLPTQASDSSSGL